MIYLQAKFTPPSTKLYPHHHQPKLLKSQIIIPLCQCIPLFEERLIGLQQRRIYACIHLPADHPLQPPMIESIQSFPVDVEGADDHTWTDIANIDV